MFKIRKGVVSACAGFTLTLALTGSAMAGTTTSVEAPTSSPEADSSTAVKTLVVDGVRTPLDAVSVDTPKFLAVTAKSQAEREVLGFKTKRALRQFVAAREDGLRPGSLRQDRHLAHTSAVGHFAKLYEHVDADGGVLRVASGTFVNLTSYNLSCPFIGSCTTWNDQASSIITYGRGALLYEHVWYGGRTVYIGPNVFANLTDLGFNDTASSTYVYW